MHGEITVPSWPSALDCLAWSADCELAVAAGEVVELLIPRNKAPSQTPDRAADATINRRWENIHLRTNIFSEAELPLHEPAPFRALSTGEEISTGLVAGLDWSPPGLAKHRRCALAVHTQNLVLSVWESTTNPLQPGSWRRALIVNHELERYFAPMPVPEEQLSGWDPSEVLRLRRRIRAFSWCPSTYTASSPSSSVTDCGSMWGTHLLAVCNDFNEVAVLQIQSPYSMLATNKARWSARTLGHFSVCQDISFLKVEPPLSFEDYMSQQRFVSHLAWSPWIASDDGSISSLLVYSTTSALNCRPVQLRRELRSATIEIIKHGSPLAHKLEAPLEGPLRWSSYSSNSTHMFLVAFLPDEVLCFQIFTNAPMSCSLSTHNLDGRWDPISGIAFSTQSSQTFRVHFASHTSSPHAPTTNLKLPLQASAASESPSWQGHIHESHALFSAQHELAGHVFVKQWGLATSPFGDLIASCITLHPSDMLQYEIPADHQSFIAIDRIAGSRRNFWLPPSGGIFPRADVSAETIFFYVKRWFARNGSPSKSADASKEVLQELHDKLGLTTAQPNDHPPAGQAPSMHALQGDQDLGEAFSRFYGSNPEALSKFWKRTIYLDTDLIKHRYENLVSLASSRADLSSAAELKISLQLIAKVLKLPQSICNHSKLSKRILRTYILARSKLQDDSQEEPPGRGGSDSTDDEKEQCEICDDPIDFESVAWARCSQGHQFPRCSLTFLAVQAPGISKYCGICGKQYLSDQYVFEQDAPVSTTDTAVNGSGEIQVTDTRSAIAPDHGVRYEEQGTDAAALQSPLTLAQLLIAACDLCVYCGGKFVG